MCLQHLCGHELLVGLIIDQHQSLAVAITQAFEDVAIGREVRRVANHHVTIWASLDRRFAELVEVDARRVEREHLSRRSTECDRSDDVANSLRLIYPVRPTGD